MGGAVASAASTVNSAIDNSIGKIPVVGHGLANVAKVAPTPIGGLNLAASVDRSIQGYKTMQNAPRDAANQAEHARQEQSRLAAEASAKLALQPKKTASDDFLANKNKMLQNMRLGLMSSVGGSVGSTPTLSAPSLSGKSKLGA